MQTHFALLFIGADCISVLFQQQGVLTLSVSNREELQLTRLFLHTHILHPYSSLANTLWPNGSHGLRKMLTAAAIFDHLL